MLEIEKYTFEYFENIVENSVCSHNSLCLYSGAEWSDNCTAMKKLAKNVSAMANSGGGVMIFGIQTKSSRAFKFNFVTNFNKSEEWILNEIQSQIECPVKDLYIGICNKDKNQDDKIIYIYVPISNDAPHTFSDNKFYKWQKSRAVVLSEPEIRAMYGHLSSCELEFLGVSNTNGIPSLNAGKFTSVGFYPKFMIRNAGNVVEKDYKIEISFPASLYEEENQPLKAAFIRHEGSHCVFGQRGNYPIFQQEISTIIEAKICVNAENISDFLNDYINVYLYYSNGLKKHSIKLCDTFTYNGNRLKKDDFTSKQELILSI